jgi:hypothetical protein
MRQKGLAEARGERRTAWTAAAEGTGCEAAAAVVVRLCSVWCSARTSALSASNPPDASASLLHAPVTTSAAVKQTDLQGVHIQRGTPVSLPHDQAFWSLAVPPPPGYMPLQAWCLWFIPGSLRPDSACSVSRREEPLQRSFLQCVASKACGSRVMTVRTRWRVCLWVG